MSQTPWQEHVNAFVAKICCNTDIYDMIWHHVLGADSFFTHQNRRELCEFCARSTLDLLYPMWNDWDCSLPGCTNSRTSMPSKRRCGAFWVELWVCIGKSSMYLNEFNLECIVYQFVALIQQHRWHGASHAVRSSTRATILTTTCCWESRAYIEESFSCCRSFFWGATTLQGTNTSPQKWHFESMIFLFPMVGYVGFPGG